MNIPSILLNGLKVAGIVSVGGLLTIIAVVRKRRLALSIVKALLSHVPILSNKWRGWVLDFASDFIDGAEGFNRNLALQLSVLSLSTILMLAQAAIYVFSFKAFSLTAPLAIITFGSMLMSLSFVFPAAPGYVGTFEAFWALVFVGLGFRLEEAIPVGLTLHLVGIAFLIVCGSIVASWRGVSLGELLASYRRGLVKR